SKNMSTNQTGHPEAIADFIANCIQVLGQDFVLTDETSQYPYLIDWRQRFLGTAVAVLLPQSKEEVASLVQLCASYQV
ncbi:hypothetical protein ABTK28_22450, partial [Acinetobacter baumannii]